MSRHTPPPTSSRRAVLRTAGFAAAATALTSSAPAVGQPRRSVGVIGAGVVGLQTARVLAEAGYRITVYARDITPGTTSDVAWALIFPHLVPDTTPVLEAVRLSNAYYAEMAEVSSYVSPRTVTFAADTRDPEDSLTPFAALYPSYAEIPSGQVPGGYRYGWRIGTWWVDPRGFMPYLVDRLMSLGATLTVRVFSTLDELLALPHDVIVNCAGLGGGTLAGDAAVYPIKGQLVTVLPVPLTDPIIHDTFHIFPRADGAVLGGTHDERSYDVSTPEAVTSALVAGNRRVLPELDRSQVVGVRAGLRPFREGGPRLEAESRGGTLLVHNYGHGGSGWTLAPGCALQVLRLVQG
jgi:D-amino-acid oxidase